MRVRRDTLLLAIWLSVTVLVPLALRRWVDGRVHGVLEPAIAAALGLRVAIGDVEFELLGTLRLERIAVGASETARVLEAESIAASVGLGTLLGGTFAADEIRVRRPHLAATVLPDGSLDVATLFSRAHKLRRRPAPARKAPATAASLASPTTPPARLRRIVVTDGDLVVEIAGRGQLRARNVEIHPQAGGVRVVTGKLSADLLADPWRVSASFARAGLDVALPQLTPGRVALDGGHVAIGGPPALAFDDVVVLREVKPREDARLEARLAATGQPVHLRLTRTARAALELEVEVTDLPLAPLAPALPGWVLPAETRVTGKGTLRHDRGSGEVSVALEAAARGLLLQDHLLASEPVPVDADLGLEGTWHDTTHTARGALRLRTKALVLEASGLLGFDPHRVLRRAELQVDVPPAPCATTLAAIPQPMRAPLDGLELDGTFGARLVLGFDLDAPTGGETLATSFDTSCRVVRDAPAANPALLAQPFAHTFPDGRQRRIGAEEDGFVALSSLPPHVFGAFVAGEDARFFGHHGFDPIELRRSFAIDLRSGRVERGGSTISQQLMKNLYLPHDRTLARKLVEAILTWRLESTVDKRRILEIYLNIIELGDGIFGLEPAARRWFDKPPRKLSVAEAAFLAALTPAPVTTDRRLRQAGDLDPQTRSRVDAVLRSMRTNGLIDRDTYERARRERLRLRL